MTLSLEDVRNKRFRMSRKSGYEVLEVDVFVDEVEETFAQLVEENGNLKKQVDALSTTSPAAAEAEAPAAPPAPAAGQAQQQPAAAPPQPIVVTASKDASAAVVRLVELSTEQAERLVAEAAEEARRIREEAQRSAQEVTSDARARAERVESEARVNAERMTADASTRAKNLDRDTEARRGQLLGDLNTERDTLASSVEALRAFEATYRANLTDHLRRQIEVVESGQLEPADAPEALTRRPAPPRTDAVPEIAPDGDVTVVSDTPRLDALLGDHR